MAERNSHSFGLLSRKSMFGLFVVTTFIFIFSCFFVLRTTGRPSFIDHSLLPNSKLFSVTDNGDSKLRNQNDIQSSLINPSDNMDDNQDAANEEHLVNEGPKQVVSCNQRKEPLRVFMYDLPPEFHFELLDWKAEGGSVWPDIKKKIPSHPGGLNLQHSIEYWLTLDLLSSRFPDRAGVTAAVRVFNSSEADVIFVPFFSSVSYNRHSKVKPPQKKSTNVLLQEKIVKYLTSQEEWKRSGGRDHIVMAHHPNSLLDARTKLWPAMFVLSDFGRYPPNIANVDKDIIAPYKHVIRTFVNDSSGFDDRPTLLYFQGAIYRKAGGVTRQELFYLLKEEKDVHFSFGNVQGDGIRKATQGMHGSKFCLNIAGDTPSSNRLFDAIASHCVPVIISDDIELPFEDVINYSEFCVFVRKSDAVKGNFLIKLIRSISKDQWTRMWNKLKEVERFYEFQYPSQKEDAVQMIWQAVARKVPAIRMKLHRSRRYDRSEGRRKTKPISIPWSQHFWSADGNKGWTEVVQISSMYWIMIVDSTMGRSVVNKNGNIVVNRIVQQE